MSLPLGVIVIIILGLAVVIGLLVLAAGLYLMKRKGTTSCPGQEGTIMLQNHKHGPTYDIYSKPVSWEYDRAHSQCSTGRCLVHGSRGPGGEYEYGTVYYSQKDYYKSPDVVQQEKEPLRKEYHQPRENGTMSTGTGNNNDSALKQEVVPYHHHQESSRTMPSNRPYSSPENLNGMDGTGAPAGNNNKQRVFLTMQNNSSYHGGGGDCKGIHLGAGQTGTVIVESNESVGGNDTLANKDMDRTEVEQQTVCDLCTGHQRITDTGGDMHTFKPSLPHL